MKSNRNTIPLMHLDWNPTSPKIITVVLSIYPLLSSTFPTYPTKMMVPHPPHFLYKFEGQGGEFVVPDDSCGINFSGFNGIVECSWKATEYSHLTFPYNTPSTLHTYMGLFFQLTKKTQAALEKIISYSASYNKKLFVTFLTADTAAPRKSARRQILTGGRQPSWRVRGGQARGGYGGGRRPGEEGRIGGGSQDDGSGGGRGGWWLVQVL
ncbi:hypothetical protein VP01_102g4 [Puccinia sorghi]|uniref:Tet-like 2OG-Fe(II) oxygenase domain-containing protein n=1 Tax=Puccinia sorghi TaxID=27349 RepID=A0A0L6VUL7_9BASI|nr:hypothetical protein VP01_102g4 [Puccinia sorghi]